MSLIRKAYPHMEAPRASSPPLPEPIPSARCPGLRSSYREVSSVLLRGERPVLRPGNNALLLITDSADYVIEQKGECHYVNGTQRVRLLQRFFYNQEEFVYFDSDKGIYIAKTEFGKSTADQWNSNKDILEDMRNAVQTFCINNYEVNTNVGITGREVKPTVFVTLLPQHESPNTVHHILQCNVFGFYPSEVDVKWYRNNQEETEQVQSSALFRNGDWTFQILVMLETEFQKGDTFACEVHHKSLEAPLRVNWQPVISDSAKSKMATGIGGFVLGGVFLIAGIVIYMRGRKVQTSFRGPQSEHFIHS